MTFIFEDQSEDNYPFESNIFINNFKEIMINN